MSELINFEYPPPRSWEQFEELCADLFEAMWNDTALVRHGRAGQVQFGVDIIAARGSIYPVGLQCKKKAQWPLKRLTLGEIEHEIDEAAKFTPALRELYILTTAVADQKLQLHVRNLNKAREQEGKFPVVVLFWAEIVRKVARFDHVAKKHFPIGSGAKEFAPLLATWYTKQGRLELTNLDWTLAVSEIGEDFHEWPKGRVIVRQRETDAIIERLQNSESTPASSEARASRIMLRRELRYAREKERRAEEAVRFLFTNERLKFYMLDLDETGISASRILQSVIEFEVRSDMHKSGDLKIRISPPTPCLLSGPRSSHSVADTDFSISLTDTEYSEIMRKEREFPEKYYGNLIHQSVGELPESVRTGYAIPSILRRIRRIMEEDGKTTTEMQLAGYLDLDSWNYTH